ncbi:MAG: Asp-tRNA(Asn)/Glu-tRNA(Gln) amidotransferase GatCAB subunit C [Candidatus Diapherotrites archaeon CG11_big_fil_rev_8_21_14_0_20_37_9]|nr:MAG: Asp-tRNA(Asn)/Glu-tRNA(Gln) amidotransferase GatCAB subunit C [Candidatus Diapherotrites archaeon CG11_big_fil_rev_8_21_14_0_20_37_9]
MPKVVVDKDLLVKVAGNARLNLTDGEIKKFLPQLKDVFESFSALDEVDINSLEPSFQPIKLENVFREDVVEKCISNEDALANTPHKKDGYFKGPKVI